jgi:hypothetical protein
MPLRPGFTRFRGIIMNGVEADCFRRMTRKLQHYVDARQPVAAQQVLTEIKDFAGDHELYRPPFEILRHEHNERWLEVHGTTWRADYQECASHSDPELGGSDQDASFVLVSTNAPCCSFTPTCVPCACLP